MKLQKTMKLKIMNNVFLLLILFFYSCQGSSQVFVKNSIFEIEYSEKLEQPVLVKYTVQCQHGKHSRKGISFYKNDSIHTSDDLDYKNNIWDKGHMAPAASFSCNEKYLYETFSYINCALQHQSLNRGPWKELEKFERNISNFFKVDVIIKIIFKESKTLSSGATIPSHFIKTISFNNHSYSFEFPNSDVSGKHWSTFKIKN